MNLLIIIIGLLIVQVVPGLHDSTDRVYTLQKEGEYTEALSYYQEYVAPLLVKAPNKQKINARLVEVLLYRKLGYTERGLDSLVQLMPLIPDSLPTYKMIAFSHRANLKYDAIDFEGYYQALDTLYILAKEQNDYRRMNRALGNMYWYFEEKSSPERLEEHIRVLEGHLDRYPDGIDSVRYFNLKGRFLRDVKSDYKAALIQFGKAKNIINSNTSFQWYEIVSYEQYTTALADGNMFLAEMILKELSAKTGTLQNPNALYSAYSAFVRLYVYKSDIELANEYWKLMQLIPEESLNKLSIRDGVYAEIALNGGDAWEIDPLMKHAKKSSFSRLQLILTLLAAIGIIYSIYSVRKVQLERSNLHALSHWSLVE
jgi:tetratricopeptide (TPR) repeat protein